MIHLITRLAALLLLSGLMAPAQAEQKINVFVSIAPQQHFVEQVGGDWVAVSVMVGPGKVRNSMSRPRGRWRGWPGPICIQYRDAV